MTGLHPHEVGIAHMTGQNSENTPERPPTYASKADDHAVLCR
jgi:hypothetical protein